MTPSPSRVGLAAVLALAAGCAGDAAGSRDEGRAAVAPVARPRDPEGFLRLRSEYGERDDFIQLCEENLPYSDLEASVRAERWEDVVAVADAWLAHCPIAAEVHVFADIALTRLGRSAEASEHREWTRGLVDSILRSGDGKTPETAFVVVSVGEEYTVLHALRLRFKRSAFLDGRIDRIDRIDVESDAGETSLYFDLAAYFRRVEKMFAH